jgi:O-antigen ligase
LAALATLAVVALFAVLVRYNAVLQFVAGRFEKSGESRPELWRDTLYAIHFYWPYGSGIGTFVPTFVALEPLEVVDSSIPNRAHNDYLELALEAGALGAVVLLLSAAVVIFMIIRSWREQAGNRAHTVFCIAIFMIVAAHSIVDYPMRSLALACLVAVAAGMLASPVSERKRRALDAASPGARTLSIR